MDEWIEIPVVIKGDDNSSPLELKIFDVFPDEETFCKQYIAKLNREKSEAYYYAKAKIKILSTPQKISDLDLINDGKTILP